MHAHTIDLLGMACAGLWGLVSGQSTLRMINVATRAEFNHIKSSPSKSTADWLPNLIARHAPSIKCFLYKNLLSARYKYNIRQFLENTR